MCIKKFDEVSDLMHSFTSILTGQINFVILLTIDRTILIMLVQRI